MATNAQLELPNDDDAFWVPANMVESEDSFACTLKAIDAAIAYHNSAAARLKARRNAMMPVSRLPSEVLAYIFHWYIRIVTGDQPDPTRLALLREVCRSWDEVVMSSAALWSRISVTEYSTLKATQTWLARSKEALLDIEIFSADSPTRPEDRNTVKVVMPHIRRARTLSLEMSDETYDDVADVIPSRAPYLQTLEILAPYSYNRLVRGGLTFLACCEMPCLLHLSLKGYHHTPVLFPPSITHLQLSPFYTQRHELPTVIQTIATLTSLECLTLDLETTFTSSPHAVQALAVSCSLPRLKKIDLSINVENTISTLLDCFVVPSFARIRLRNDISLGESVTALASSLSAKLKTSIVDAEDKYAVEKMFIKIGSIAFFKRMDGEDRAPISADTILPHLEISCIRAGPRILQICDQLPLRDVIHLSVDTYYKPWLSLVQTFHNIETLEIGGRPAAVMSPKDIITLLRIDTMTNQQNGRAFEGETESLPLNAAAAATTIHSTLPKLKRIILIGINFYDVRESNGGLASTWFINGLRAVLRSRHREGAKVEEMEIKECFHVNEADIEWLRRTVAVDWDGKVQTPPTLNSDDESVYMSDED
ncbi:hypothetical protein BXZ70DRAFT_1010942 [Cristinia sonorae]|uniref:F-box domain-containing protein n=1 Tax=Cristinia sonorae TaxID=1940300 RepID=A0A8K0XM04_9AGAR|nr:hypothetical protein BXZ70DRAFT_1010942 [Cristinia sonorae]